MPTVETTPPDVSDQRFDQPKAASEGNWAERLVADHPELALATGVVAGAIVGVALSSLLAPAPPSRRARAAGYAGDLGRRIAAAVEDAVAQPVRSVRQHLHS
ncbi:hypothetical protein [Botrimarina sp.]|uniref:hypothetical protein n=1 Tax=Botrimarina sp. TaxID=2795802 RepID=UPI0032ECB22D